MKGSWLGRRAAPGTDLVERPMNERAGGRVASPEARQEQAVPLPQPPLLVPFTDTRGNGGSPCVPDVREVHHRPLRRDLQVRADCLDDPKIGLMGDEPVNVVDR